MIVGFHQHRNNLIPDLIPQIITFFIRKIFPKFNSILFSKLVNFFFWVAVLDNFTRNIPNYPITRVIGSLAAPLYAQTSWRKSNDLARMGL